MQFENVNPVDFGARKWRNFLSGARRENNKYRKKKNSLHGNRYAARSANPSQKTADEVLVLVIVFLLDEVPGSRTKL